MPELNITFIDVETSPVVGYTWGVYDTNVLSVIEQVKVICMSWKNLGDKKAQVKALPDYAGYTPGIVDDTALINEAWDILDKADVVIAHNADAFDLKVLNTRFVAHGLNAPSNYETLDTLKSARKYFRFQNNSLDELGKYLKVGQKAPTGGFETWLKCIAGDKVAWDRMRKYNVQDIDLLERVYLKLRPFIDNHPNLSIMAQPKLKTSDFPCGTCLSLNTQKRGFSVTKMGRYQRYQCLDCGSWSSGPYQRVYNSFNKINAEVAPE